MQIVTNFQGLSKAQWCRTRGVEIKRNRQETYTLDVWADINWIQIFKNWAQPFLRRQSQWAEQTNSVQSLLRWCLAQFSAIPISIGLNYFVSLFFGELAVALCLLRFYEKIPWSCATGVIWLVAKKVSDPGDGFQRRLDDPQWPGVVQLIDWLAVRVRYNQNLGRWRWCCWYST